MDAFMHTPFWRALILFSLALLVKPSAQAQPDNNNFSSAWVITGTGVTTNGSNVNATKETGEPNHAGNQGGAISLVPMDCSSQWSDANRYQRQQFQHAPGRLHWFCGERAHDRRLQR